MTTQNKKTPRDLQTCMKENIEAVMHATHCINKCITVFRKSHPEVADNEIFMCDATGAGITGLVFDPDSPLNDEGKEALVRGLAVLAAHSKKEAKNG